MNCKLSLEEIQTPYPCISSKGDERVDPYCETKTKLNSVAWVRERTIPS
jgi:hypothetical protein